MAGYWPSSFFCVFMDRDEVEVHKLAKKERGQYPAILTEQTWSIKNLLYGFRGNFACGIQRVVPSGQDGCILPNSNSLSFRKFKVALNPMYRIALNVSLNLSIYYSFRHVLKPGTPEHQSRVVQSPIKLTQG